MYILLQKDRIFFLTRTDNPFQKPFGDPSIRLQAPFGYTTEWLNAPMEGGAARVNAVCVVTYTERVIKPRSSRLTVEFEDFCPQTLMEKTIELIVRPFARSSSFAHDLASPPLHLNGVSLPPSSGSRLQGVWRERSSLSTSVDDIPEEPPDSGSRPRSGSLSYAKTVQANAEDDFFRPRTASGTMTSE